MVERRREIGRFEIRPQNVGKIQLGIGRLPEQEIRQPHLARGADEQVERRHVGGVEMRRDRLRGDRAFGGGGGGGARSEEHTSALQSLMRISYAVFCLQNTKYKDVQSNKKIDTPQD